MRHTFIATLLLALLMFSCSKDEDTLDPADPADPAELLSINFDKLEVGQKDHYAMFTGISYYDEDPSSFIYRGDTLIVEVVEALSDSSFVIREYFTDDSEIHSSQEPQYYWGDPNLIHEVIWTITNDALQIEPLDDARFVTSPLTFEIEDLPFFDMDKEEIQVTNWLPVPREGDHVNNIKILDKTYERLNMHVDNTPMSFDGNGMTIFYSRIDGIVRTMTYSAWTGSIIGWDKI